jgi:hypothetical protein
LYCISKPTKPHYIKEQDSAEKNSIPHYMLLFLLTAEKHQT